MPNPSVCRSRLDDLVGRAFRHPGEHPSTTLAPQANHSAGLLIIALGLITLSGCGCAGFSILRTRQGHDAMAHVPKPRFSTDPQMEEVVDHLNRNVQKLHSWQAHSVKIRANNMPLSGTLAVQEGQHLRLVVNSIAGHEVDMGSNDDVFWIWAKRMDPSYVYCHHTQIDAARQTLGVPFEPQWLMQALGVAPLETQDLQMQIDPTGHQARLVQPVVTAHGLPLQKVIQVDLVHGVITEHSVYDGRGHKIAQARLEDFRVDKHSGIVLPHRVRLDWPQNQMSMVMNLGNIEVNPRSIPPQIWDMPAPMPGVQIVDLGKIAERESRIADSNVEPPVRLRDQVEFPEDDVVGRVRFKLDDSDPEPTEDESDRVDKIDFKASPAKQSTKVEWWDE